MAETIITCVICPVGCSISVEGDGKNIESIKGAACRRGDVYARNEYTLPVRILTSIVKVEGGRAPLVPVRSTLPVPKKSLFECMDRIRKVVRKVPVLAGEVIIADICSTGADIVATDGAE